jgi:hypothetical protein
MGYRVHSQELIFNSRLTFYVGICLMTTAACTSYQGLYVQRFFLGALESGVSPGWMLVVSG